jgi:CheY-like chemotaxis protein
MKQTNSRSKKEVLIVDDEPLIVEMLCDRFMDCTRVHECPYDFEVEVANSAVECVQKIRARASIPGKSVYDVIVLDMLMEGQTSGLDVARSISSPEIARSLAEGFGFETPVRIVVTGFPNYNQCVEVMRSGAWDYIVKEDVGHKSVSQIVVDSAVARLRQLDSRQQQERQIAADWIPRHFIDIQNKYSGKLIALWHQPKVEIIASGADAFELEDNLKEWRSRRVAWEQPFVVRIPPAEYGS